MLPLFVGLLSIVVSAAVGYFLGVGTSPPHTGSLRRSLGAGRSRLQETSAGMRTLSAALAESDAFRERSGTLLVMSTTTGNVANDLARIEASLAAKEGEA